MLIEENQATNDVVTVLANEAGMADLDRQRTEAERKRAEADQRYRELESRHAFTDLSAAMERQGVPSFEYDKYAHRLVVMTDNSVALRINYPAADEADPKPIHKYFSIDAGVRLLQQPNNAEQVWIARVHPPKPKDPRVVEQERLHAAREKWARLPAVSRSLYAAAERDGRRDLFIALAEALAVSPPPDGAPESILKLVKVV